MRREFGRNVKLQRGEGMRREVRPNANYIGGRG